MTTLITGITGFAGGHLAEFLIAQGNAPVCGCSRQGNWPTDLEHLKDQVKLYPCDLTNFQQITELLEQLKPTRIYHLAAMAQPSECLAQPDLAVRNNVDATRHILDAAMQTSSHPQVLHVSTSHVYGFSPPDELPMSESTVLRTGNDPYSQSKLKADLLCQDYAAKRNLHVVIARPFHHVGPRRSAGYAISSWAEEIAHIELGHVAPEVKVGNLESRRDYTDVRDIVRGYYTALEYGGRGDVFNLGSGISRSMQTILTQLLSLSTVTVQIKRDPERFRDNDPKELVADASRLQQRGGWRPKIPFEQTLQDTLDYFRYRLSKIA